MVAQQQEEAAAAEQVDRLVRLLQQQPQDDSTCQQDEMLLQQPQQQVQIAGTQQDAVRAAALLQQEQAGHQQSISLFQQQQHHIVTQDTSRREEQHHIVSCQRNQRILEQRSVARMEEQMSESISIDGDKSKKKKAVVDIQGKLRTFFSNYSERHELINTTETLERIVHFYAGREYVVMRLITYIEDYEPHLLHKAQVTLEDYRGQDDQLLSEISRWEEAWANEALGVPNSAGGAAAGVTENDTLALGVPNSAGGAAGGGGGRQHLSIRLIGLP
jgi:hypothetical protein